MDCYCDIYDIEKPRFFKSVIRQARKEHVCCECWAKIKPNDKYEYSKGVWDSEFDCFKTCLDCKSLRDVFFSNYIFGQIWDNFKECYRNEIVPEECISKLTKKAREKVCNFIEEGI